ncbi:sushi domain-containing protein 5 [Latimeria chalumnae]|uniref:sushi domain-containing protein 5 n=1 Tax=Latimeria chalumnae TaxID=7897 RepID=UPI00313CB124
MANDTIGKVFTIESENGSQGLDLAGAQASCAAYGARLATAKELKQAVQECSFTACTRGWLADSTIGTTICNKLGTGQQSMKAIDVQIESEPYLSGQYDSFCIKDKDKPCGDPPSFPHTILQDQTGFEMGDELLYVCDQGYAMANGETAFTLLCDSCGEWYGLVQACVKDETVTHIDYEDKFPDERSMSFAESEDEDEEFDFSEDTETKIVEDSRDGTRDIDPTKKERQEPTASTESPVSLLSQKHLFWFPSEAFPETGRPEPEERPDEGTKNQYSDGDNHIGVKTDVKESGTKTIDDNEDFPIEPSAVPNHTKTTKETVASTDDSWLDGYPVTQEAVDDGEKVDGSMETDDEITLITDRPNHVDLNKADVTSAAPPKDVTQIVSPTRGTNYDGKDIPMELTPTAAPENVSASKGIDDIIRYRTTTSPGLIIEESTHIAATIDSAGLPTAILKTTEMTFAIDHAPVPAGKEETTIDQASSTNETTTEVPIMEFTDTGLDEGFTEEGNLTDGTGAKLLPTSETCAEESCTGSSKGPMIATIVTVICLIILATALAVWCYKRRQQKSSVYKMNGKGQTRHPQQIEMQKV